MKILNFGSLNIDYVYKVDHMVRSGETQSSSKMERFCGGKGLNQSIALAKAGAKVYHAGCVGSDGVQLIDLLKSEGVDCSLVKIVEEVSGHAIIQVDKKGENSIIIYSGANGRITSEHIDEALAGFNQGDILLIQNEINNLEEITNKASGKGMKIAINPSPYSGNIETLPLNDITYFIMNEVEGKELTGHDEPEMITRAMRTRFPKSIIVLTLGSNGSVYDDGKEYCYQEVYDVEAVDTTAAGDTFTGYFLHAINSGATPQESLQIASKAAAIAVTRRGAAPSIPGYIEVEEADLKLRRERKS